MRHYPPRPTPNPAGHWSPWRNRREQARFRQRLIQQQGLFCQRCGTTGVDLQAHHTTPTDGLMLCRPCHRAIDPYAR